MITLFLVIALVLGFFLLGKAADVVVVHIRHIGERLGVSTIFLGLVLGLFTSMPEFGLAVSAFANQATTLSFGNLLGGIAVLVGLILGVGAVLNRTINTKEVNGTSPFSVSLLFLPFLLGFDGQIGQVDGLVLVLFYLLLGYVFFVRQRRLLGRRITFFPHRFVATDFLYVIVGSICILLIANGIIRVTLALLEQFQVPAFLVGLVVFGLGTNLPELSVTVRSWWRGASDLSLSHILGSALANVLLIGMSAIIQTIPVTLSASYVGLTIAIGFLLFLVFIFARSGNRLSRYEGLLLFAGYLLVLLSQTITAF